MENQEVPVFRFILAVILVSIAIIIPAFPASAEALAQTVADARSLYITALEAERNKLDTATPMDACNLARSNYLAAAADLEQINNELDVPANDLLGSAQAEYQRKLKDMKRDLEMKILMAKGEARIAGTELANITNRLAVLNAEINRLKDAARQEAVPSRTDTNKDRAVALGYIQDDAHPHHARRHRVASIVAPFVEQKQDVRGFLSGDTRPATLTSEFAGCYPDLLEQH